MARTAIMTDSAYRSPLMGDTLNTRLSSQCRKAVHIGTSRTRNPRKRRPPFLEADFRTGAQISSGWRVIQALPGKFRTSTSRSLATTSNLFVDRAYATIGLFWFGNRGQLAGSHHPQDLIDALRRGVDRRDGNYRTIARDQYR